jgi:transposase
MILIMGDYELSTEEILGLKAAHKTSKQVSVYQAYRIHVIILLGMGMTPAEVSEVILLDEDTVRTYSKKYNSGGLAALLETNYVGSNKKLTEDQILKLREELDNNIHLTTKSVCRFVLIEFDVEYSERGMASLLKSIGYVYKKPDLKPGNPDEQLQEYFLEQYAEFLKNKKDTDLIFFMDAVHPIHNVQPAYGWFRKGEKRKIKSNTGRERYNIHGAMNAETYEVTAVFSEDNIDATSTIDLLKTLEKTHSYASNIYILLDNARYHFSKIVQEYIKDSKIKLIPLPAYSPELNLIERFWKLFKKKVIYNTHYRTFKDFKLGCLNFFKKQHLYEDEVISIMGNGLLELV